jgi:hypothetical protein
MASVEKVYTVLSLALLFLDFRIFLTLAPLVVALTQTARLIACGLRSPTDFFIGPILICWLLLSLCRYECLVEVSGFAEALRAIDHGFIWRGSWSIASIADFWCSGSIAPIVIHSLVYPLVLMVLEVVVFMM